MGGLVPGPALMSSLSMSMSSSTLSTAMPTRPSSTSAAGPGSHGGHRHREGGLGLSLPQPSPRGISSPTPTAIDQVPQNLSVTPRRDFNFPHQPSFGRVDVGAFRPGSPQSIDPMPFQSPAQSQQQEHYQSASYHQDQLANPLSPPAHLPHSLDPASSSSQPTALRRAEEQKKRKRTIGPAAGHGSGSAGGAARASASVSEASGRAGDGGEPAANPASSSSVSASASVSTAASSSTAYAVQPSLTSPSAGDPEGAVKRAKMRREGGEAPAASTSAETTTPTYPTVRTHALAQQSARRAEDVSSRGIGGGRAAPGTAGTSASVRRDTDVPRTTAIAAAESGPRERRPSSIQKGKGKGKEEIQ